MTTTTTDTDTPARVLNTLQGHRRMIVGRLTVNGVPIDTWRKPALAEESVNCYLNPWLKPEDNQLSAHIRWPEGISYEPGKVHLELRLAIGPEEEHADPEPLLTWPTPKPTDAATDQPTPPTASGDAVNQALGGEFYPSIARKTFRVDTTPPIQLWNDLEPLSINREDAADLIELVCRFHRTLNAGDIDGFMEQSQYRREDMARAAYLSQEAAIRAQRNAYGDFMTDAAWAMAPMLPTDLRLDLIGDNKLVWVTRAGGQPALQSMPVHGIRMKIGVYLGKIDGQWTWVR